jgi:biotin carboxyl carrier protein
MIIQIESPMEGAIVEVYVVPGAPVSKDTDLFMIEQAKTTLIVRSTVPGTVGKINVAPGDDVAFGFVALTIDDSPA